MPVSQNIPYCSAQNHSLPNTWRRLALWRNGHRWHWENRKAPVLQFPGLCLSARLQGHCTAAYPSHPTEGLQALLLSPVLENHKFIYLQYVPKIKWP